MSATLGADGGDVRNLRDGPLGPLVERYIAGRLKRREVSTLTMKVHRQPLQHLARVHGNRPAKTLGRAAVERWLEEIGACAPSTRRMRFGTARQFMSWLVAEGVIVKNPMLTMRPPRQPRSVPRALTSEQVAAMLTKAPDSRARLIVWLGAGLGLRRAEIAGLRVEDYLPAERVVMVKGKGGHERVLPVPDEVRRPLEAYLAETGVAHGPLLRSQGDAMSVPGDLRPGYRGGQRFGPSRTSKGIGPEQVARVFRRVAEDAGVKTSAWDRVGVHSLRHTAASDVFERTHDLTVVMEMLGHQHLQTTSIYMRRAGLGKLREAMAGRDYRAGVDVGDA